MTYPRAFIAIGSVLVAHQIAVFYQLYFFHKWFDIPMHFLGGFAFGILAIAILHQSIKLVEFREKHRLGFFIAPLFILGFVGLIGIVWEWHEFLLDQYNSVSMMHQPSIADTMADFALDLLGGLVATLMFWRGYEKR